VDGFALVRDTLLETNVERKIAQAHALFAAWQAGELTLTPSETPVEPIHVPGRPDRPTLVSPFNVARRSVHTREGRGALIHALAHIEFNAINLALDAAYRFRDLPRDYVGDWLKVASEEAYHFSLLREHLTSYGFAYGDFNAHDGLWEMAVKTAHDPLVRMALVPRVLEARGIDASPALMEKFKTAKDARAVEILEIILRDEIGHVVIGNRWYRFLCEARGVDPLETFRRLLIEFNAPRVRAPFFESARKEAGFTEAELRLLSDIAAARRP
jgi:uncharacterized ferritin-like protein (DUF455 family)